MKKEKKRLISERRRTVLFNHFMAMDHGLLCSLINAWLKDSEVKELCEGEGLTVK